jgi:hypothetical protein
VQLAAALGAAKSGSLIVAAIASVLGDVTTDPRFAAAARSLAELLRHAARAGADRPDDLCLANRR